MNASSLAPEVSVERPGRRAAWLVGLGVAACAGCCVAPVLVALGVGAVAATAIGVWLERIAGALFVATLIGGAIVWYRRRRASTDRSCACSLPRSEGPERLERFRSAFVALIDSRRDGRAVVFELERSARPQVEELTKLESKCCSFLRFEISERGERLVWRVDGPPSAQSTLDLFADLPRLASSGAGLAEALARLDARRGQRNEAC